MPDSRDVILKHIDAFNGRESDADPWAADAEMTAPGARVSGRDNVLGFLGVFQEAFPDIRLEIDELLTDGPAAPAGRAVVLPWAAVYLTDGDTLKSEHLFFDQMDFLGQLGLIPG